MLNIGIVYNLLNERKIWFIMMAAKINHKRMNQSKVICKHFHSAKLYIELSFLYLLYDARGV